MILFSICIWLWIKTFQRWRREPVQPDPVQQEYLMRIALANKEFDFYKEQVEDLRTQRSELSNRIWWYEKKGLPCNHLKKTYAKVEERLHKAEVKMTKAELDKMRTERKYKK